MIKLSSIFHMNLINRDAYIEFIFYVKTAPKIISFLGAVHSEVLTLLYYY